MNCLSLPVRDSRASTHWTHSQPHQYLFSLFLTCDYRNHPRVGGVNLLLGAMTSPGFWEVFCLALVHIILKMLLHLEKSGMIGEISVPLTSGIIGHENYKMIKNLKKISVVTKLKLLPYIYCLNEALAWWLFCTLCTQTYIMWLCPYGNSQRQNTYPR